MCVIDTINNAAILAKMAVATIVESRASKKYDEIIKSYNEVEELLSEDPKNEHLLKQQSKLRIEKNLIEYVLFGRE